MFTENPVTGADERVIEASWGLGEAVVAGLVIPDTFRVDRVGRRCSSARPGCKRIAIRTPPDGGTVEEEVPADLAEQLCLDDDQLEELNAARAPLRGGLRQGPRHRVGVRRRDARTCCSAGRSRPVVTGAAAGPGSRPRATRSRCCRRVPLFAELDQHGGRADRAPVQGAPLRRRRDGHHGGLGRRRVLPDRLGGGDGLDPRRGARDPEAGRLLRRDRADRRGPADRRRSPRRPTSSATGSPSGSSVRSCRRTARSAGSCCSRWRRCSATRSRRRPADPGRTRLE